MKKKLLYVIPFFAFSLSLTSCNSSNKLVELNDGALKFISARSKSLNKINDVAFNIDVKDLNWNGSFSSNNFKKLDYGVTNLSLKMDNKYTNVVHDFEVVGKDYYFHPNYAYREIKDLKLDIDFYDEVSDVLFGFKNEGLNFKAYITNDDPGEEELGHTCYDYLDYSNTFKFADDFYDSLDYASAAYNDAAKKAYSQDLKEYSKNISDSFKNMVTKYKNTKKNKYIAYEQYEASRTLDNLASNLKEERKEAKECLVNVVKQNEFIDLYTKFSELCENNFNCYLLDDGSYSYDLQLKDEQIYKVLNAVNKELDDDKKIFEPGTVPNFEGKIKVTLNTNKDLLFTNLVVEFKELTIDRAINLYNNEKEQIGAITIGNLTGKLSIDLDYDLNNQEVYDLVYNAIDNPEINWNVIPANN